MIQFSVFILSMKNILPKEFQQNTRLLVLDSHKILEDKIKQSQGRTHRGFVDHLVSGSAI